VVPQSGSSSTESNWNLEMLIFMEGGKQENLEKTPQSKGENQQQTQLTYDTTGCGQNWWSCFSINVKSYHAVLYLLQKFLVQTGGHQGGWDDYDNQLFLQLKAKHKVIVSLQ
jgi:hypothetical protein